MRNVKVSAYVDDLLEKLRSERVADAQEVMEYLTAVMRREKTESVVVTLNKETSTYVPDEQGIQKVQDDSVVVHLSSYETPRSKPTGSQKSISKPMKL